MVPRIRILDRQRYWSFVKAYVICFSSLVGLYIVIHAFANVDEFGKAAPGLMGVVRAMGFYYLIRISQYYDQLCGVIAMMAAIFTVTFMQKDNQLVAMLAAGISTHRAIRPVLVCSVLVSLLAVINQELILPRFQTELSLKPDDDGKRPLPVSNLYDLNEIPIHGRKADRARRAMILNATLPIGLTGTLRELEARDALHIPHDHPTAPLKGGWLLRGATISPPLEEDEVGPLKKLSRHELNGFPPSTLSQAELGGSDEQSYFFFTNITFEMLTRDPKEWMQYASSGQLIAALGDPSNAADHLAISIQLHQRLLRPFLSLALLCAVLPSVLGGPNRNMFISLGYALGTTALFYGGLFLFQYLATRGAISPIDAAFAPLAVFSLLAAMRWSAIRT
ncbi:permease YjgP/YjgQ family protein [Isosphaera pallida ATCC 43644]|uniref:Permease YjgP/YjgQ family protein n=1 Tax=Isosphaera pallida (strain ATCC 43644 / DSM 9630 / IS1B) TaxID=575540 RepID=E8QXW3_ISOPI|nr:LptF/LptG family permease [Isosphaera pallida]ADV60942.1 permease YjgP/YjgQ family protein [Isosphaera pallida ATCC 43644]